eukprot:1161920-Pelagomonas_calceolata.AAC.3
MPHVHHSLAGAALAPTNYKALATATSQAAAAKYGAAGDDYEARCWITNRCTSWGSLVHHRAPWCIIGLPGASQGSLVHHRAPWCITGLPGASQGSLVHHRAPWYIIGLPGAS